MSAIDRSKPQRLVSPKSLASVSHRTCAAIAIATACIGSIADTTTAQNGFRFDGRSGDTTVVESKRIAVPSIPPQSAERRQGTFVALDPTLKRIMNGREPRTVQELIALEDQQTKVIERIRAVTVNVQQGAAQGSGVIVTDDGYVLTAAHVAGKPGRDAIITMPDGQRLRAKTKGMNRSMDAGLIKITQMPSEPLPYTQPRKGASSALRIGSWVVAAGHPGGWMNDRPAVMRVGRVIEKLDSTIVTDCALIGGDSGGPLFDLEGRLVGIHSRIGIEIEDNMHVPSDVFHRDWDRLARSEAWGTLPGFQPRIGVQASDRDDVAELASVTPNGPADRAGIKPGDIVVAFDGYEISSFEELKKAVESMLPGDRVKIVVLRDSKRIRFNLTIGLRE